MKLKNFFDLPHQSQNRRTSAREQQSRISGVYKCTDHFLDLSRGGGFLGMRKRALIGCMSHRAGGGTTDR